MSVLAIDQGTTGTTTMLIDDRGRPAARAYREFRQFYPRPGWVEHDAEEIWRTVVETVTEVRAADARPIRAVGITNQRETTVLWNRATGRPVHHAICWQCRRTADLCRELAPHAAAIRARTGLPLDAYFSGTKLRWLLDHADTGDVHALAFGTIDTWLIWKLTGGRVHATDYTNASRTLLYNTIERRWDDDILGWLDIPAGLLPEVRASQADYGAVTAIPAIRGLPIAGVAGDQQAALFGQTCFRPGETKSTYGTGAFLLMNTGAEPVISEHGLITTLAAGADGKPCYALEGSVFIAGAAIQWLRDELGFIKQAADSEAAARAVADNGGVYLVPAFVGLGAPHWDMRARGVLTGLTRGAGRNHIVRAALESIAYQTADVLAAMQHDTGKSIPELAVDGGAAMNDFLLQFQADILDIPVARPVNAESTSLGAAYLAGLHTGVWKDAQALVALREIDRTFKPAMDRPTRDALRQGWQQAIRQARTA